MTEVTPGASNDLPPRGGDGRWRRGVDSAERDAEACRLYVAGKTYLEISNELGYGGKGHAHKAVQRVLLETVQEPADEVRALLKARNEEIYRMALAIALKDHLAHGNGRIVYGRDGVALTDDGPKLAAMDRMQRALAELAKLHGAHAPTKFEGAIPPLEVIRAQIAQLEEEARAAGDIP